MRGVVNQSSSGINITSETDQSRLYGYTGGTYDKTYEMNLSTLAEINSCGTCRAVGGMHGRLFSRTSSTLYEMNQDTLADTYSVPLTTTYGLAGGFDGTYNRLFFGGANNNITENDPDTGAQLGYYALGGRDPEGVGGTKEHLYCINGYYTLMSFSFPVDSWDTTDGVDVGGTAERLFVADGSSDHLRERNPHTLAHIQYWDSPGEDNPDAICGTKGDGGSLIINEVINDSTDISTISYNGELYFKY